MARPERTDRQLVDACLEGDAQAWDELVERYGRLVYSVPRRLGLPDAEADDVFQIVFGIVLRRLETLRDVDRLSAWLLRTTFREAWRIVRRQRPAALPDELPAAGEPSEAQLEAWERQHLVRRALALVDARCRALLEALFFEQPPPSYHQIAARLDMRVGSIGPTRARCFQKLEVLLNQLGL
jgi:RNA polymerase sigma factor (sigma-70 family)